MDFLYLPDGGSGWQAVSLNGILLLMAQWRGA